MKKESVHQHQSFSRKKQVLIPFLVLAFLIGITVLIVLYGRGYRLGFQQGEPQLTKTGILNITSKPVGANIYINDHLTTATNNTINLTPGKYKVKVAKEGYYDWQKDVDIQKEVVINADVTLYPKAPTLQSVSTFGVDSVVIDPSGTKLAFQIGSQSAVKNGIYIFDMTSRSFPVLAGQSNSTQLANDTLDLFSQAHLTWSPDGKQILASTSASPENVTYYLLKTDGINETPQDITATVTSVTDLWQEQRQEKNQALLKVLKPKVQKFAKENFHILSWSPDENKILYQAKEDTDMPVFLTPRRIGNNVLYERRDLEKGAVYAYNIKEDTNTRIVEPIEQLCNPLVSEDCVTPFSWMPDTAHLVYVHDDKIDIIEDDGANITTLYAGPFLDEYVFPWPDGSKVVILTNLNNTSVSPTLYTIGLK